MKFRRSISPRVESLAFDEKRFWMGISVGIAWSIVMYLLLQVIRSATFFVFGFGFYEVVVIDIPEYRFYSFIIAFFSILFGAYQFLEFTLFKNRSFFKRGFHQKVILFNQRNIIWSSLFVISKFFFTIALTILVGAVSQWKIYASGFWTSILFSFFLYFYFWNNLKRVLPNAINLSLFFLPVTLGLAFGLAQIKPIDMEYYQKFGLRHKLHYSKQIDVPQGTDLEKNYKRSSVLSFYIAEVPNHSDSIQYYYRNSEIELKDVFPIVEEFKKSKSPNYRHSIIANVIIDKDIKMKHVCPLLNTIRYTSTNTIGLVGIQKDERTRKKYFSSFPHHLKVRLSLQDDALTDLAQHLQKNPNAPKSSWQKYLDESMFQYPSNPEELEISFSANHYIDILPNGGYSFNEKKINPEDLINFITTKIQNQNNQLISFYLDVNPNATYESYFHIHHEFKRAKREIRNDIALEKFSKRLDYLSSAQQKEIRAITPYFINEAYNANEKFLYDFFKKNELPN